MTLPDKYKVDDLLTIEQIADYFGYSEEYLRTLNSENGSNADPLFRRMRIKTDPSWRQTFQCQAHYVYRYGDLKAWFRDHQTKPAVQTYNISHGIIVDL